MNELVTN